MKRLLVIFVAIVLPVAIAGAQEKKSPGGKQGQYSLDSANLDEQGKGYDGQIRALCADIAAAIKKYDLLKNKNIRFIPFQTSFIQGNDYIEMEKHTFITDEIYRTEVVGIRTKRIKIFTNGQDVQKIESEIYERRYYSGEKDQVVITDTAPLGQGTDNITFTHRVGSKTLMDGRRLGDIKNSTAFPLRTEIKRDFLIPNLTYFKNSLQFIGESYAKLMKDSEESMSEFLKNSLQQ